jgi:hypothetical protein
VIIRPNACSAPPAAFCLGSARVHLGERGTTAALDLIVLIVVFVPELEVTHENRRDDIFIRCRQPVLVCDSTCTWAPCTVLNKQSRLPSAGFTFCSGEPHQFRSRTAANALSPNPARPCRLAVSRPCAPLMSGWRVDTPSAAARLGSLSSPVARTTRWTRGSSGVPSLARRTRAGRRRGERAEKLRPQPPRRGPGRPREPRVPEVAQRTCATRDAPLGLGFFPRARRTTTPPFGVSRARFFTFHAIPADRRDPPRPARPSRRPPRRPRSSFPRRS